MHASVMAYLRERAPLLGNIAGFCVLEVGSYDENGSPREVFQDYVREYVGCDQRAGRGVDEVCDAALLPYPDAYFDLVISTEMLEHDPTPWKSVVEMARVMGVGGHLLLTARGFDNYGGYPRHDCPADYWRFNDQSFAVLLDCAGLDPLDIRMDPEAPGVFAHAVKP
jgi:SAM-dependent methyltransferase